MSNRNYLGTLLLFNLAQTENGPTTQSILNSNEIIVQDSVVVVYFSIFYASKAYLLLLQHVGANLTDIAKYNDVARLREHSVITTDDQ